MIRGFRDACDEAETAITGGQTVLNPWPIIGGVATSVVAEGEYVPSGTLLKENTFPLVSFHMICAEMVACLVSVLWILFRQLFERNKNRNNYVSLFSF